MFNSDLIWSEEEYKAICEYKGNSFAIMNVLLNRNVSKRELRGKYVHKQVVRDSESLRENINKIFNMYSAILKNYLLNGSKPLERKVFRGMSDGIMNTSFISTSESVWTALGFVKSIEKIRDEKGLLLMIDTKNVPWVELTNILPTGIGADEEPEILFLPFQVDNIEVSDLEELFEVARNQGESIVNEEIILKRFKSLKCEVIHAKELNYSEIESDLTLDDLCNMVDEYVKSVSIIRSKDSDSPEFIDAYFNILKFKKNCNDYIGKEFKCIHEELSLNANKENNKIELSPKYTMERVNNINKGELYYIDNLESGERYYFKPLVSEEIDKVYIQEVAYNIQKIINPEASVKCNVVNINDEFGAIQEKINVDNFATNKFIDYFENCNGELSSEMIEQILNEYLVDYVLCNYDSYTSNFVIDENGNLRGINKENSFAYIEEDYENDMLFSRDFDEQDKNIYSILFRKMMNGDIPVEKLKVLEYRASRLAQFPDDQYRKLFVEYAYGKCSDPKEAELLLSRIVERKANIVEKIELLSEDITRKNLKSNVKNSVIDFAVSATEKRTTISEINEQSKIIQECMLSKSNIVNEKKLEDK